MEKKDNLENWKKNAINELKTPNVDNIFINTPEGINIKLYINSFWCVNEDIINIWSF